MIYASSAAIALLISASSAFAQEQACAGFADKMEWLATVWGETQHFVGLDSRGLTIVMTLNPETRSWTALQVEPSGWSCAVAAGTDGEFTEMPKPGDPA